MAERGSFDLDSDVLLESERLLSESLALMGETSGVLEGLGGEDVLSDDFDFEASVDLWAGGAANADLLGGYVPEHDPAIDNSGLEAKNETANVQVAEDVAQDVPKEVSVTFDEGRMGLGLMTVAPLLLDLGMVGSVETGGSQY